jgi:hypothetical protein
VLYNVADLLDETADADALIAAIQDATTGPWNEVDGLGGSVLAVEGRNVSEVLIVRQNPQTHREIAELLVELRAELERPNR